jgi:hypothetical protein
MLAGKTTHNNKDEEKFMLYGINFSHKKFMEKEYFRWSI